MNTTDVKNDIAPIESKSDITRYVARLVKEWDLYEKIVVAVDFDDTVSPWQFDTYDTLA